MKKNLANVERILSFAIGGLALSQSLRPNNSKSMRAASAALGMGLLARGSTGYCPLYDKLNIDTSSPSVKTLLPQTLERSALVNKKPQEVAQFLSLEYTPYGQFQKADEGDSFQINFASRIWTLELSPHADGKRTLIKLFADELPQVDAELTKQGIKETALTLENTDPNHVINLRKIKSLIETGELASIEGQPHGERSYIGGLFEKYGDRVFEKIQSRSELPSAAEEIDANTVTPTPLLRKEARA